MLRAVGLQCCHSDGWGALHAPVFTCVGWRRIFVETDLVVETSVVLASEWCLCHSEPFASLEGRLREESAALVQGTAKST